MPKFSIIIPVYNVEKYLRQCIESVLSQDFSDFEIIAVDDCSTDNSLNILKEYAKRDKRLKILKHKNNKGQAAARNYALDNAKGEYIVCIDSDDWMEPHSLSIIYSNFLERKTETIWFNARKYFENEKRADTKPMYDYPEGYRVLTPETIAAYSDFIWVKAYTRKSIEKYHIRMPEGLTFEDGEFYFKYFTLYPKSYVIQDCLINYRYIDDSTVRKADRGEVHMNHVYDVLKHLRQFWIELGIYHMYKITMLKLIQNRIRMCYGLRYSLDNKKLSYNLLRELKYPEDFSKFITVANNETPLVSVVVPFYNVEKYIPQCLDSIINQTYKNIEIICVDDCSQDNSFNIVKEYMKKDSRIKLFRHKKNKKLGGARNTGLKKSKGDYLLFIDSDDWIDKKCVEIVAQKLNETKYDTVWFKARIWWENKKRIDDFWFYKYYDNYPEGNLYLGENNLTNFPFYTWNKAYRRDFLINNKLFWNEHVYYEDIEFYYKMALTQPQTYMIDKPLYYYRRRNDAISMVSTNDINMASDMYKETIKSYKYVKKHIFAERYKNTFIRYIMDTVNTYKEGYPKFFRTLYPIMFEYLKTFKIQ